MKNFQSVKQLFTFLFLSLVNITFAQDLSLNLGADVASLYIWRGLNINDAVNIQPSLTLSVSGLSVGFWGSYGFMDKTAKFILYHELLPLAYSR